MQLGLYCGGRRGGVVEVIFSKRSRSPTRRWQRWSSEALGVFVLISAIAYRVGRTLVDIVYPAVASAVGFYGGFLATQGGWCDDGERSARWPWTLVLAGTHVVHSLPSPGWMECSWDAPAPSTACGASSTWASCLL